MTAFFLVGLCIAGAAFFAASETALLSLSLSGWERLRRSHPELETGCALWKDNPNLVIGTILLGSVACSLAVSIFAVVLTRQWFGHPGRLLVLAVSFGTGTLLLIVGEILPKLFARRWHDFFLIYAIRPLCFLTARAEPLLGGLERLSNWAARRARRSESLMTPQELRLMLSDPRLQGVSPSARRVLSNIVSFHQMRVSEVMVPRYQMVCLAKQPSQDRMFEAIVRSGFSRIPVYFGNIDNLLGIVYAKDLLVEWRSSGLLILDDLLRPPYRIAPDAPLSVLLQGFRQGNHMAIVTDERGRTQGLVTVEDVVEAIVGDIADEFDPPQPPFRSGPA